MSLESGRPATTIRYPLIFGLALVLLFCANPVFAIPFQVNIAPNDPLKFGMNVTSGGTFGGASRDTLSLGNWIYDFTVTESKQFQPPETGALKRDRIVATGFIQHNVKPPGDEHTDDANKGKPLNFGFLVDATEPNKPLNLNGGVAGGETHAVSHFDRFAILNLRVNTNPATREINNWSFRVEGNHLEAIPEPTTLALAGLTAAGLGLARSRQGKRGKQQP